VADRRPGADSAERRDAAGLREGKAHVGNTSRQMTETVWLT